jgi:hypothetical protein
MNSSANQISPISHRREVASRVANFSWPAGSLRTPWKIPSPDRRLRARICRQWPGLRKAESWAHGEAGTDADSPLVELPKRILDGFTGLFSAAGSSRAESSH